MNCAVFCSIVASRILKHPNNNIVYYENSLKWMHLGRQSLTPWSCMASQFHQLQDRSMSNVCQLHQLLHQLLHRQRRHRLEYKLNSFLYSCCIETPLAKSSWKQSPLFDTFFSSGLSIIACKWHNTRAPTYSLRHIACKLFMHAITYGLMNYHG